MLPIDVMKFYYTKLKKTILIHFTFLMNFLWVLPFIYVGFINASFASTFMWGGLGGGLTWAHIRSAVNNDNIYQQNGAVIGNISLQDQANISQAFNKFKAIYYVDGAIINNNVGIRGLYIPTLTEMKLNLKGSFQPTGKLIDSYLATYDIQSKIHPRFWAAEIMGIYHHYSFHENPKNLHLGWWGLGYGQIDEFHYSQHVTTQGFLNEKDKQNVLKSLQPNPLNDPIIHGIILSFGSATPIIGNGDSFQLNLFVNIDFFLGLNRLSWSRNDGFIMLSIGLNTFLGDFSYKPKSILTPNTSY